MALDIKFTERLIDGIELQARLSIVDSPVCVNSKIIICAFFLLDVLLYAL